MADSVETFARLCKAEALLWQSEMRSLHDAVDWLQNHAVGHGLIDRFGQDAVQLIMARGFAAVRDDLGGWRP